MASVNESNGTIADATAGDDRPVAMFSNEERFMKGNPELIKTLNELLAEELTAINQYMVHSEMCDNWGYEKLHKAIEKRPSTR